VVEGLLYGLLPGQAVARTWGKVRECLDQRGDGRFRKHDPAGLAIDPAGRDRLEEQFLAEVDHVDAGRANVAVAALGVEFRPI
jgi:hypothetical protein